MQEPRLPQGTAGRKGPGDSEALQDSEHLQIYLQAG